MTRQLNQLAKPRRFSVIQVMQDEASYICDSCGEEIVIPLDLSAGHAQQYVEDCPVCCRANVIDVVIQPDGEAQVWAEAE